LFTKTVQIISLWHKDLGADRELLMKKWTSALVVVVILAALDPGAGPSQAQTLIPAPAVYAPAPAPVVVAPAQVVYPAPPPPVVAPAVGVSIGIGGFFGPRWGYGPGWRYGYRGPWGGYRWR
jgi:hypothetical protein